MSTGRILGAVAVVAAALAQAGCATVFSGLHSKVKISSTPPGANVVVIGGEMGSVLLAAKKQSDRVQLAVKIVKKVAPAKYEADLAKLEALSADELIPKLVYWLEFNTIPEELEAQGPFELPKTAQIAIMEILGIGPSGVTPYEPKLRKGTRYAIVARKDGYRGKVEGTTERFNWVFLLNIFNAFLLSPVDIASGAWFNVRPEKVELVLAPLPPPPPAPPAVSVTPVSAEKK